MDISISHDMAQRALKQRNMLAIATLILSILAIIMFIAASNRDREIILQPVVPKAMAISSSGVSSDYLEAITRDTAQLALNRSPETLQYWMDNILAITAPEARGPLKGRLLRILDEQSGSQVTQFVTIDWIRVDPDDLTSEVGGVLHTVVGSKDVRREHRVFRFKWKYEGLSLKLMGFGVVVKKDEET